MKIITYYCEECVHEIGYPDCGKFPVYSDCRHCGTKVVLFWKHKDRLLAYLDHKRMRLNQALCKLLGITYEQVMEMGGMHVVMKDASVAQR